VASAPPDAVAVAIVDFAFAPPTLTVPQGTTVVWTDTGEASHTVSAVDDSFGSDILGPGTTYANTFDTPGTFAYVCRIHAEMQAQVIVTADPNAPSASPIPAPSASAGG
jgi:plastocyanin